jgi:uncharacterized protein YehS (DUF1456 family)
MLRDDQIVEILELVDFRITKLNWALFPWRNMKTIWNGDQVLRNFLNAWWYILRNKKKTQMMF